MTVRELIEQLQGIDPDYRVSVMTELDDPELQVEAWVTGVASCESKRVEGHSGWAIIIGREWEHD